MIEAIITTLIYVCLLAAAIYIILWVISSVAGIQLPPKVVQIIWIVFVLICLLLIVRLLLPHMGKLAGAMLPLLV
jgi:hypothetical protein